MVGVASVLEVGGMFAEGTGSCPVRSVLPSPVSTLTWVGLSPVRCVVGGDGTLQLIHN